MPTGFWEIWRLKREKFRAQNKELTELSVEGGRDEKEF